jgi:hypothetical protein
VSRYTCPAARLLAEDLPLGRVHYRRRRVLELDHVFCIVSDPDEAVRRLEDDGWVLDAGQAPRGQGTRNRRLCWAAQFLELLWVSDAPKLAATRCGSTVAPTGR